jgi:hypothetical protein
MASNLLLLIFFPPFLFGLAFIATREDSFLKNTKYAQSETKIIS